jgi:mannose-1-phosphate guanylyltransferase
MSQLRKGAHDYAVIMAGGGGTRLWPISRRDKPKQFQLLVGERSLLQMMYETLSHCFRAGHIFVQSPAQYLSFIKEQLPAIDDDQIIIEPEARDTAPAFGFAAAMLAARDPDAVLGIFYSDNVVQSNSTRTFYDALEAGFGAVEKLPDRLVMIGVRPLYPHTGLGYIEVGKQEHIPGLGLPVFSVKSFIEKPDVAKAKLLAASGMHLWNTGYKILRAQHLLKLLADSNEDFAAHLPALTAAIARADKKEIAARFASLPSQSFEYLISEKAKDLLTISAGMDWSDLGDWEIIHRLLAETDAEKLHTAGKVIQYECEDTLLLSHDRPVVAIGVQDLIVIETKDVVLVMSKRRSQDIKAVLKELTENDLL